MRYRFCEFTGRPRRDRRLARERAGGRTGLTLPNRIQRTRTTTKHAFAESESVKNLNRLFVALSMVLAILADSGVEGSPEVFFEKTIAPLLSRHCVECHSESTSKGRLALDSVEGLTTGGRRGPVIVAGDPEASRLYRVLVDTKPRMPKNAPPLEASDVDSIRRWIVDGAVWPEGVQLEPEEVDLTDWWSLRPLLRPSIPHASAAVGKTTRNHPIDAFLEAKRHELGLTASPRADRRTLLRRLYFDLIGLPPSPADVRRFLDDTDEGAYERLVDRLLSSPRYGERWARHWLDVAHYADTHGYDKDKPRPNAWPYRDYVVRAFNEDKSYGRFIREQLAGDELYPGTLDGVVALGFVAAGPWDFIGHAEVPETKLDGRVARNLDRDDMVTTAMNVFQSTTVQCARCHDHKFDPVTQQEYYSLQAVFAAVDRADRPYDTDPAILARRQQLQRERTRWIGWLHEFDVTVRERAGARHAELDEALRQARNDIRSRRGARGFHSEISTEQDSVKWVQVDLGAAYVIERVEYVACDDDFNDIGAGFGFPLRYRIELSSDPAFESSVTIVDATTADVPNPGVDVQMAAVAAGTKARYVRVTATKLTARQDGEYVFALAELVVTGRDGSNLANGAEVAASDAISVEKRWRKEYLVDASYPGLNSEKAPSKRRHRLQSELNALRAEIAGESLAADERRVADRLAQIEAELSSLPEPQLVYAATIHHGRGSFRGRGPFGGAPREIRVLYRGDLRTPGPEAIPAAPRFFDEPSGRFELDSAHGESERRAALAEWLADHRNPLTWRSIVNRVWHYHMGRGLVDSPNDFGRMGQRPSHPELLDWLAVEFRDGGQSFKRLHRLIVTSEAYQQSSAADESKTRIDGGNVYLWRMNRRRLEAEATRDSVLAVSGQLNRLMYGPGFRCFVLEKPEHSPHYEYHKHNPADEQTHRRSIYRFIVRSQPDPFMQSLDCVDSSQSVAKRNETLTALQSLALLNNKFMLAMAAEFAARLRAASDVPEEQLRAGYRLALAREPTPEELRDLVEYASVHGLENACRVLFNLNEFVFAD